MFTWICPKCGAEVPPHENECPRCLKEQLATAQQIAVPQPVPPQGPPPPPQAMPPQQPPPQYQGYPGQYPYPPPQGYPQQPYPPQYGQQPPYPQTQYYPQGAPPPQPPPPGQGQPQMLTSGMMPAAQPAYTPPPVSGAPTAYTQPPPPPAYAPPSETYNTTPLPSSAPPPPPPPSAPPPPVSHRPLPIKDAFSNAPPPPPPSQGLPSWAIVLLVAALLIGAGYAGITFFGGSSSSTADVDKRRDKMEPVTKGAAGSNPFAKHLELTGIRVAETRDRKLQVRMVVINHSGAELPDLNLSVALKSTASKAGDPPITQFKVKLPTIGAYESRELKADATTQLRAYEFPDWQFLRVEFEILDK